MLDRSFVERNRASTERMRRLVESLSDDDLMRPLGEHWTIAAAFAHLVFWDGSVLAMLESGERAGKMAGLHIDIVANDASLPLWLAVPPREAASMAIATAEALDRKLEALSPELLAQVAAFNPDDILPALHRDEHLDEIDRALKG